MDNDMSVLIDTRLLGKPGGFEGDGNIWRQWRFQVMAYFGAIDSDIADDLVKAEALTDSIIVVDLSSEKLAKSQVVYYVLSQWLNEAPLQVLMSCPENNGYEACWLLNSDYERSTGSRHVAMLSNILKPQLGETNLDERR